MSSPDSVLGLMVVTVSLANTTVLLACTGKSTAFSALVDRVADPVHSRVTTNSLVGWVDEDDLEVFVNTILVDPVRVENTEITATSGNSLLGSRSERTLEFEVVDTLTDGFTEGGTLLDRFLSVTTTDTDTVDHKALFGLVAQTSGLVRSRWTRGPVDDVQLTVFPATDPEKETKNIGLFLLLEFFDILVGTHLGVGSLVEVEWPGRSIG